MKQRQSIRLYICFYIIYIHYKLVFQNSINILGFNNYLTTFVNKHK